MSFQQDRGVLHITEALIEQANYFKVLHGSSAAAPQALSSKHTLTRGDKIETKYECLARLINATKPNVEISQKHDASNNFNALVTGKNPVQIATNIAATTPTPTPPPPPPPPLPSPLAAAEDKEKEEKQASAAKSDNNNPTITAHSSNTITTKCAQDVCELKIVEDNEQNTKQIKSDNDDDSSMATSINTASLDCSEKQNVDANTQVNVEDNNNGANDIKCDRTEATVPTNIEQTTEIVPKQRTIQPKDDLTECLDESQTGATEATDCHLDINENKSDIKINYAEVVKVENALEPQLCENKNFSTNSDENTSDHVDNKNFDSTRKNVSSDLDEKVQNTSADGSDTRENADNIKRNVGCSSPKPIQTTNTARHDEPDEEMSPVCKVRLPLNSPRLTKSKDIMSELPLTPDSSHSLDSSCEYSTTFETIKTYNNASIVPERSFSSESLNSETSIESNDSKSSIKLTEAKFSKNGTLERQNNIITTAVQALTTPNGLQVLMLWNNHITRDSAQSIANLLAATTTLEILNVGKNVLSNDFVANIKASLKANTSLTSFGLQSVHLSNEGVKILSEILDFGGNVTLQRVDLRDNNLQVSGLQSLNEVLKSNKSITRIDLDDVPRRAHVSS